MYDLNKLSNTTHLSNFLHFIRTILSVPFTVNFLLRRTATALKAEFICKLLANDVLLEIGEEVTGEALLIHF